LEGLKELDFDIDLTGFSLDDILVEPTEGLTDEDAVPEAPDEPVTVEGDIWVLGDHRVMCGDSTSIEAVEKLMDGEKADMVFTDPPYGIEYERHIPNKTPNQSMIMNDHTSNGWLELLPHNIPTYICTRWDVFPEIYREVEALGHIKNVIVWDKLSNGMGDVETTYAPSHEFIFYVAPESTKLSGNRDRDVWSVARQSGLHPTMKPVELVERAVKNSSQSEQIVLDLFLGSGTTLIACEKTNRKCYGMELDPKYCDVIINRWQDYTGKKAIHEATGVEFGNIITPEHIEEAA